LTKSPQVFSTVIIPVVATGRVAIIPLVGVGEVRCLIEVIKEVVVVDSIEMRLSGVHNVQIVRCRIVPDCVVLGCPRYSETTKGEVQVGLRMPLHKVRNFNRVRRYR
jgi:hypothetical protein